MKLRVISDNTDTLTGMRLAGVEGAVVHERDEFERELSNAASDETVGIILVTELLARRFPEQVKEVKLSRRALPLLIEIPDRHGTTRPADFITEYIREAIGVRIK